MGNVPYGRPNLPSVFLIRLITPPSQGSLSRRQGLLWLHRHAFPLVIRNQRFVPEWTMAAGLSRRCRFHEVSRVTTRDTRSIFRLAATPSAGRRPCRGGCCGGRRLVRCQRICGTPATAGRSFKSLNSSRTQSPPSRAIEPSALSSASSNSIHLRIASRVGCLVLSCVATSWAFVVNSDLGTNSASPDSRTLEDPLVARLQRRLELDVGTIVGGSATPATLTRNSFGG